MLLAALTRRGRAGFAALAMGLVGGTASAQTPPTSLAGQLQSLGSPLGSGPAMSALTALTALEVSTAPLGTSTGGFSFTFDPRLRVWRRSASTFGPAFSERSLTTGRARVCLGFNWLHAGYSSFGGFNLSTGALQPARNVVITGQSVASSAITMHLSSDTVVAFGHVGLTDDLDVGVAVPFTRVSVSARGVELDAAGATLGTLTLPATSAFGIGDVALYAKYRLWKDADGGVAAAVEVRTASGDPNALRGLGVTRTLMAAVWSRGGRLSPHVNVGYELWSAPVPISPAGDVFARGQFKFAAGVELDANPRATVIVDLLGRTVRHGGSLGYQTFTRTTSDGLSVREDLLVGLPNGVSQLSLAPGIKWNAWRNVLVTANALVSLTTGGVRARVIPVVGLDWAF